MVDFFLSVGRTEYLGNLLPHLCNSWPPFSILEATNSWSLPASSFDPHTSQQFIIIDHQLPALFLQTSLSNVCATAPQPSFPKPYLEFSDRLNLWKARVPRDALGEVTPVSIRTCNYLFSFYHSSVLFSRADITVFFSVPTLAALLSPRRSNTISGVFDSQSCGLKLYLLPRGYC